jgi:uncharacterized iron-regulated membrane protein
MTSLLEPSRPRTRLSLRKRAGSRPRLRPTLVKAHRWGSFGLGLLLLVVVISGVVLVLQPEIEQVTHPSLYDTDPAPARVPPGEAFQVVHQEMPDVDLTGAFVQEQRGAWEVHPLDGETIRVDDTDGRLLGTIDREHGVMGFIANLHECGLGCEEMSGYVGFLNKPAQVAGFDLSLGNENTWGGIILLVSALLLLVLVVSGLCLWWPGRGKLRRGLKVRRGRGRYKLHYDLHKVVGFVALPALAIWAVTGINFELPKQLEGAWYAVTPGQPVDESIYEFESKPGSGPGVDMRQAIALGAAEVPAGSKIVSVSKPELTEKTSYYELWFTHGVDTYEYGYYPGNYGVYVDRYSGRAEQYFPDPAQETVTSGFWQQWMGAIHMGTVVGWIPRLGWIVFGLAPLLLAVTGTVTWLIRRRMRKRKAA